MATMRYCLDCGYGRKGLPDDAVCPECGEADIFEKQREICTALANKPLALLWRVMTLRRMPKGWWVVFEQKPRQGLKPWQFFLVGILLLLAFSAANLFIHIESTTTTFLYNANDPQQTVIQTVTIRTDKYYPVAFASSYEPADMQVLIQAAKIRRSKTSTMKIGEKISTRLAFGRTLSNFAPKFSFIGYILAYTLVVWFSNRFILLPLIARDPHAPSFQHAAQQTSVIYLAHGLWLISASSFGFMVIFLANLVLKVQLNWITNICARLLVVILIFGPAIFWARLITTDNLKIEFPKRLSAGILLIGLTVLATLAVFTWPWF